MIEATPVDDREAESPPWERLGRRDALPHRGTLLKCLSLGAVLPPVYFYFPIPGTFLSILVLWMGVGDLRAMRRGEMDRGGRLDTKMALINASLGLVVGVGFGAFFTIEWFRWFLQ